MGTYRKTDHKSIFSRHGSEGLLAASGAYFFLFPPIFPSTVYIYIYSSTRGLGFIEIIYFISAHKSIATDPARRHRDKRNGQISGSREKGTPEIGRTRDEGGSRKIFIYRLRIGDRSTAKIFWFGSPGISNFVCVCAVAPSTGLFSYCTGCSARNGD